MENQRLYAKITDEYSSKILKWAVKKTGNRPDGEDLAQEVFMKVFIAVSKQEKIDKLENFVWKVAHFVWCNHVRALVKCNENELSETLPDSTNFTMNYAEDEALQNELNRMRCHIADLSKIQREAMICHYLDGLSVREVAKRLNTTESAVTWHLFDARKKVKKELNTMKDANSYVYRPGKLRVSASGEVPVNPDTNKINDSMIRQNLCLLCYQEGKTIDELVKLTGIPKSYLEYDLEWLTEKEFLNLDGKHYQTTFLILNQKHFEYRKELYQKNRSTFIDGITKQLWESENRIRSIDFCGADFPTEKLMWSIIMMFLSYVSRNSELLLRLKNRDNCEIHLDGGKYHVMAADYSDGHQIDVTGSYNSNGWNDFYGICCDNWEADGIGSYYWLGVYNFCDKAYRPEIITSDKPTLKVLHKLYCDTSESNFKAESLTVNEKDKLAEAVQIGLITKDGYSYKPNFVIFTKEQLAILQNKVFAPMLADITPKIEELYKQFSKMHKADFPKAKQGNIDHHVYIDLWMFGVFMLMYAAEDKKLYLPETPEQGTPLTLVLIK